MAVMRLPAVLVLFLVGCRDPVVAHVGDERITQKMVDARSRVAHIYYPHEQTQVGRDQLVRALRVGQVLKNNGRTFTDAEIVAEEHRIDTSSKAPDLLARIKAVFGTDTALYRQVFVRPTLIERTIHPFFLWHEPAQRAAKAAPQLLLNEASADVEHFAQLASRAGCLVRQMTVTDAGLRWHDETPVDQGVAVPGMPEPLLKHFFVLWRQIAEEDARWWQQHVVPSTKQGQLYPTLIERDGAWLVAAALGDGRFSIASCAKADFEQWLGAEMKKVNVELTH